MVELGHQFVALTAGPVGYIKELVELYRGAMASFATFTRAQALECFRKPLGQFKRRIAESHLQARIGIGYDEASDDHGYGPLIRKAEKDYAPSAMAQMIRAKPGI